MPTYNYRCSGCNEEYVFTHKMTDEAVKKCPNCKGETLKVVIGSSTILTYSTQGYKRRLGK
jgi:putative FmdB family regulatory protein